MRDIHSLANPPIREALIDFQVRVASGIGINELLALDDAIKQDYPKRQQRWRGELEFKLEEGHAEGKSEIDGYAYVSVDERRIVQIRQSGFTFNWLEPYTTWKDLHGEASKYWKLYSEIASPVIVRTGLRYINNLRIPLPIHNFGDYLTCPPQLPEELPQELHSFLTRVVTPIPDTNSQAIISQALQEIDLEKKIAPIILDIDLFNLSTDGIGEQDAWQMLEQFRAIKNRIFFESITDKAEELYQ